MSSLLEAAAILDRLDAQDALPPAGATALLAQAKQARMLAEEAGHTALAARAQLVWCFEVLHLVPGDSQDAVTVKRAIHATVPKLAALPKAHLMWRVNAAVLIAEEGDNASALAELSRCCTAIEAFMTEPHAPVFGDAHVDLAQLLHDAQTDRDVLARRCSPLPEHRIRFDELLEQTYVGDDLAAYLPALMAAVQAQAIAEGVGDPILIARAKLRKVALNARFEPNLHWTELNAELEDLLEVLWAHGAELTWLEARYERACVLLDTEHRAVARQELEEVVAVLEPHVAHRRQVRADGASSAEALAVLWDASEYTLSRARVALGA